jgi:hypothetical protein
MFPASLQCASIIARPALGLTDKLVAEKKARQFIQEGEREAAGILEPRVIRDAAMRPLTEHLEDYVADLEGGGGAGAVGAGRVCQRGVFFA